MLDMLHRGQAREKWTVRDEVAGLLIVYNPLCLNCSTCVIMANSATGKGRSLYTMFKNIMPRAEEEN